MTLVYEGGIRKESRFDLAEGEEGRVSLSDLTFTDARPPGPAKGTPRSVKVTKVAKGAKKPARR